MTRRLGTALRRRGRDFIIASVAVVTAAAAVAALIVFVGSRASTDTTLDATRDQIERVRSLADAAGAIAGGDITATTTVAFLTSVIDRTHHGLRFGDRELDLGGATDPSMKLLFTGLEPAFEQVLRDAAAVVADPLDDARAARLASSADAYGQQLVPVLRLEEKLAADREARIERLEILSLLTVLVGALAIIIISPLTRRRRTAARAAARLRRSMGSLDHLTGLPRRPALRDYLDHALARLPGSERHLAVLQVDVDDARRINREHGREVGDEVLVEVARRLRASVRGSDLVVRIDADEFSVVIDGTHRPEDAARVAEKIALALGRPFRVGSLELEITASVGIAVAPTDADESDVLVEKATIALHAAKRLGRGHVQYYSPTLRDHVQGRVQVMDGLRRALDRDDELWVAYQPQIGLREGDLVGVEALVRWTHPALGGLMPADFIPIAEESDLILELGRYVLDEAVGRAAEWLETTGTAVPVSVNVSARQFRQGGLREAVREVLDRHGLDPQLLEIELTEAVLMDDTEQALATMQGLRSLGIRIAVDDFGTGYSSLSYLKRFPIDSLKIDQSFIRELSEGSEDAAISTAIIALAHSLGLEVIAEGVETRDQLAVLRALGCDVVQGFLFARPMPASAIERMIAGGRSPGRVLDSA